MPSGSIKECSGNPHENYGQDSGGARANYSQNEKNHSKVDNDFVTCKLDMSEHNSNKSRQHSTTHFELLGWRVSTRLGRVWPPRIRCQSYTSGPVDPARAEPEACGPRLAEIRSRPVVLRPWMTRPGHGVLTRAARDSD